VSKAKDLVYSGRFVNATEALAIGLADLVVPDADVYQAAKGLAGRYVAGAPLALRVAKQAIDAGQDVDLDDGLEIERLHFTGLFATDDGKTGLRSFVENGPGKATFSGR
jgi:enoyl-CoA hydratase/carnithine racemase